MVLPDREMTDFSVYFGGSQFVFWNQPIRLRSFPTAAPHTPLVGLALSGV